MKKSRRHHYIPQFLTGHFSKDGKILAYDKIEDKYFPSTPFNLFVEKDRNTFLNANGSNDDIIEQMYSHLDEKFSSILTSITNSGQVTGWQYKMLLFMAYVTKWRVPQYDESFNNAKQRFTIDDLGLGLKDDENNRLPIELEDFLPLEMHQEMKRLFLPLQPFRFKKDFKKLLENSFIIPTPFSAFISDCPFNEAAIISDEIFEDFVFPITKDLTLVYTTRVDKYQIQNFLNNGDEKKVSKFLAEFSFARDVSSLELAGRIVGCADMDYLKQVVDRYKTFKDNGSKTAFNLTVFHVLYRFTEYADGLNQY